MLTHKRISSGLTDDSKYDAAVIVCAERGKPGNRPKSTRDDADVDCPKCIDLMERCPSFKGRV